MTVAVVTVVIVTYLSKNNLTPQQQMRCSRCSFSRFLRCLYNISAPKSIKTLISTNHNKAVYFLFTVKNHLSFQKQQVYWKFHFTLLCTLKRVPGKKKSEEVVLTSIDWRWGQNISATARSMQPSAILRIILQKYCQTTLQRKGIYNMIGGPKPHIYRVITQIVLLHDHV